LIEAIWGVGLPADPAAALHNVIYRLRQAFEASDVREPIVALGSGYALLASPDVVDAGRFERLVQLAMDLEPQQARETLREALGVWRGGPFEGVTHSWQDFDIESKRLEALWFIALERRIECDLETGHHRDVVGELLSLTARWPANENLWALLIVAQHRTGMRSEALRTYRRLRDYLIGELGIEPSRSLQELEAAILNGSQEPQAAGLSRELPRAGLVAVSNILPSF
jgi:DNA-binding SARP family transcriptional activator